MAASTYELIVKAVDQTRAPLRRIEGNLDRLERKSKGVTLGMGKITAAITAIATGGALRSIVNTTANFEDLNDTLASVTGSARKGAQAFKFITDFSTRTQFGVEDLTTTFIKLQGAGITPTEKLLTSFTDVAAVTTDQVGTLTAITDLFSRTTSGGLGLEELNRLADRGVPVFKMLEDQLGITRLQISEFGKTSEGARKITEALTRAIDQQFGGATQQKLDNLSTGMSNFGIAVTLAANRLGTQFRPQLTQAINDATEFLTTNGKLIDALGGGLGTAIEMSAKGLSVIAQNIDLVRNAALAYIGIRFAASFTNLVVRMSSAIKATQGLTGMFRTLGTVTARTVMSLPLIGTALAGIKTVALALGPALLNPFIGIPAAVAAALVGGLYIFQDEVVNIGSTTASLGEVTKAVFDLIGIQVKEVASYFGNTFKRVIESVAGLFHNDLFRGFADAFKDILRVSKNSLNFLINAFLVSFEFIKGIVFGLPQFFIGAFNAVGSLASSFAGGLMEIFSGISDGLKLALEGDFSGAMQAVAGGMAMDFGNAFQEALDKVPPILPNVDVEGMMQQDTLKNVVDGVSESVALAITISKDYVANGLKPLTGAIEKQIVVNREALQATQLKAFKEMEAAHGAAYLAEQQALANEETNKAVEGNNKLTKEIEKRKNASAVLIERLLEEKLQLKDLQAALSNVGEIARLTGLSEAELTKALEDQIASLQKNKTAVDENGKAKEKQKTTVDNLIERIQQENKDLALLKNALQEVDKIAKANNLSQSELTEALEAQIEVLERTGETAQKTGEQTKTFAEQINTAIQQQGESLANNLARSLAQGKFALNDFKSFFNRILEDIATMIIQKRITQPLVDSILGSLGGTTGGGGIGGFLGSLGGGGGMGNMFSSVSSGIGSFFSGIGGFFGLANGGIARGGRPYLVGERGPEMFMPNTTGRVISTENMTPSGETIVNFNINAVDTQTGVEFLLKNKPQIIGMVSQAHNHRGRQGITG
tara:strand:+ start:6083 stop:9073 length:2991 start_codon:yes stop_codon:yes gene_type:complete